jgi:hypothetical protein
MHATGKRWLSTFLGLALVAALLVAFFGEVLLQGEVYYGGDIARQYLPLRVVLRDALRQGRIPWWSSNMGLGYPILAEGEIGALYPPNWLLAALFSAEVGLSLSIMLHVAWAALGYYLWGRALGLSHPASALMAMIPTLGGFGAAHQGHLSILSVTAWHPWMLFLTQRLFDPKAPCVRIRIALGLAAATAMQFLAGHPQMALLGCATVAVWAGKLLCERRRVARSSSAVLWLAAIVLGALLAAPQLLPSAELALLSQRAGGLDPVFFTSYSLHPLMVATYLSPFVLGNPYPSGSVELMGYVGILPLALASVALWRRPRRDVVFFVALAGVGGLMALGRWNPLYHYLGQVPLLNLFRVPARYLYWPTTALAVLAGYGFDALRPAGQASRRAASCCIAVSAAALIASAASVWATPDADALVALWRWLPPVWCLATVGLLMLARHTRPWAWALAAVILLAADLYAYNGVLSRTYNVTVSRQQAAAPPQVLDVLAQENSLYRIYVKEEILPAMSVMQASLYPNMALAHGVPSANLYAPLTPQTYRAVLDDLSPRWLNLLNVRYYLIPQLLPVDAASELYDVLNPFGAAPLGEWLALADQETIAIEVESYLSHATDLPDGALAATLRLRTAAGEELALPLRVGIETAEWAYQRSDVVARVAHSLPTVATSWPASSGFPPEEHVGHTYLARWELPKGTRLQALRIDPALPEAFVRVERVRLLDGEGESRLLSHLIGQGDHQIVYRSEDVLVYRNQDALPRVFTLPQSQVLTQGEDITLPDGIMPQDVNAARVLAYTDQEVLTEATVREPSYLVLADLHYPGWEAMVDGAPARMLRAQGLLRAVALEPGSHHVQFRYRPLSLTYLWRRR